MRTLYVVVGVAVVALSGLFAFFGAQFGVRSTTRQTSDTKITGLKREVAMLQHRISSLESEVDVLRQTVELMKRNKGKLERDATGTEESASKFSSGTSAGRIEGLTRDELKKLVRDIVEETGGGESRQTFEEKRKKVLKRLMIARDRLLTRSDRGFQEAMNASAIGKVESEEVRRILVDWLSMVIGLVESVKEEMSEEEIEKMREDMEDKLKSMIEQVLSPEQMESLAKQFPKGVLKEFVK